MSSAVSFSWGVSQSGYSPAAFKRASSGGGMGLSSPKLAESSPKLAESSPKLAESSPKLAESRGLGGSVDTLA